MMATSPFRVRRNFRVAKALGNEGCAFVEHGIAALSRLLPHVTVASWTVMAGTAKTRATFVDQERRTLRLALAISLKDHSWTFSSTLERRKPKSGVGATISRTIDTRERDIAEAVLTTLKSVVESSDLRDPHSMAALKSDFDERVAAAHLSGRYELTFDLGLWFRALRRLAEQTYENKALTFGCIVDGKSSALPKARCVFPADFLDQKKFRALSDGYRTAYRVSRGGAVLGFVELTKPKSGASGGRYFPQWSAEVSSMSTRGSIGLCLTRQGDLVVFEAGQMMFTYRFGTWQYWNHSHIVDIVKNAARVQHVPLAEVAALARTIYRAALDISFRRSGALFVWLRAKKGLPRVVRRGDALGDSHRRPTELAFDAALGGGSVEHWPRAVLTELASLDGAVVLSNKGALLAYGAVLDPKKKGRIRGTEGSRSKAAIGASHFGLAVKVSSDGDITVYSKGDQLLKI